MRPLTPEQILSIWEAGHDRLPAGRAELLLAEACPEASETALAALPVGRRDSLLLTLRQWAFGSAMFGLTQCPACGNRIELNFSVSDVQIGDEPPEGELNVEHSGYDIRFRLPIGADMAAIHGTTDMAVARRLLLERCLLGARRNGKAHSLKRLPKRALEAVVRRMGEIDRQADMHTTVNCPACEHDWRAMFDIVSFFWTEIERWIYRLLHEVHVLASAYSWSESDILALSPWRRRFYLGMASHE